MRLMNRMALPMALLALAGCGGGDEGGGAAGGGDNNSGSGGTPPPSTPTPTPVATPTPTANPASDHVGLGAQGPYTTLGYATTITVNPDDGLPPTQDFRLDEATPIGFRFLGAGNGYEIEVPGLAPRSLACDSSRNDVTFCRIGSEPLSGRRLSASLLQPGSQNSRLALDHTSLVIYATGDGPTVSVPPTVYEGVFAYGVPAPPDAIPVTGRADFSAIVLGGAANFQPASFTLDYAARTISGSFDLWFFGDGITYRIGSFVFSGTLGDSPHFSGTGSNGAGAVSGSFEGMVTGPGANEMMARMRFDYVDPVSMLTIDYYAVAAGRLAPG